MKITVLIKQVPETSGVQMDPQTGTLVRRGDTAIVNPLDLYGIETALRLKEQCGAETSVLSMGPPAAESALREALAFDAGSITVERATEHGVATLKLAEAAARGDRVEGLPDPGGQDIPPAGEPEVPASGNIPLVAGFRQTQRRRPAGWRTKSACSCGKRAESGCPRGSRPLRLWGSAAE